jgi:2',3'-cyclic-nucleotide 2'-phosphodiesterase (5'-nucleotidase family)
MMKRLLIFLGLCCFLLSSCSQRIPDEVEIVIISINDVHGHFQQLPALSALVNKTREAHKNVIVVDGGDRFTGNPYNDRYENPQFPITDLLNFIGFDVMVVGNTEFNHGTDLLNQRIKQTNAATITANVDPISSGLQNITPYHTMKMDDVRISFLGLTNIEEKTGKPATSARNVEKIVFYDPIETAIKYRYLKEKSDVFIALTHIGTRYDRILADSMPELDLIISSHCHTLLKEAEIRNGVLITQADRYGRQAGKTTITLTKGVVSNITNEMIDLENWTEPVDPLIIPKIREYQANPTFFLPVVTLSHSIRNFMQLGYMMTDAAVDQLSDADFAVVNYSAIRIDSLSSKTAVTLGDILRLSPFDNRLLIVKLTPAELRDFLEIRKCEMIPSGFIFETIEFQKGTRKIKRIMYPDGKELDENKLYNLAIDGFLYSRYMTEIDADRTTETDYFVVDVVLDFLKTNPHIDYQNTPVRTKNL